MVVSDTPSTSNFDGWTEKIKIDLQQLRDTTCSGGPAPIVMCRVEKQLRELKPEHYAAHVFSFGLFDRFPLKAPQTRADRCRICMTRAFLEAMGMTNEGGWEKLCSMVVQEPEAMQDRYNELERDPLSLNDVQSVLTLDAVFITSYLGSKYNKDLFAKIFPTLQSRIDPMTGAEKIHPFLVDLFKVENQIPLSLIHKVLEIMLDKAAVDNDELKSMLKEAGVDTDSLTVDQLRDVPFGKICEGAIDTFCSQLPGYDEAADYWKDVKYKECDNFLHCMYEGMFHSSERGTTADSNGRTEQPPNTLECDQSSVTDQDRTVDIHHGTAPDNDGSSVTRQDGNLEGQPQTPSEHGATAESNGRTEQPPNPPECDQSSVTDQDCTVDIHHGTAPENDGSSLTRQDGNLEGQPQTPSEHGRTAESCIAFGRSFAVWSSRTLRQYRTEPPECDQSPQMSKPSLPSVTELRKAGIVFKGRKGHSFNNISFEKRLLRATLYLPTLTMNDDTEIIWRNLVAYEHAHGKDPEFIQFLDFMDRLIDSEDDVKYLRSKKHPVILDNLLGTNEAVAKIFNNWVLQNSYYEATEKWKQLHRDIFDFYNQPARHMYLEFRKTYFSKPWLAISGFAAAILLVLTFLQTYYAAKVYYKKHQ